MTKPRTKLQRCATMTNWKIRQAKGSFALAKNSVRELTNENDRKRILKQLDTAEKLVITQLKRQYKLIKEELRS